MSSRQRFRGLTLCPGAEPLSLLCQMRGLSGQPGPAVETRRPVPPRRLPYSKGTAFPENNTVPYKGRDQDRPRSVPVAQEPGSAVCLSASCRAGQDFKQGVATHQVGEHPPQRSPLSQ